MIGTGSRAIPGERCLDDAEVLLRRETAADVRPIDEVHAVLAAAAALDLPLAVLLGAPGFYARFGFVPAADLGIVPPDPTWREHFQARPLGTYRGERGPFSYAAPFAGLQV